MASIDAYRIGDLLGEGAFASVHRAVRLADQAHFAIKQVLIAHAAKHAHLNAVLNEKKALIRLDNPGHPNIVKLHSTFKDDDHLYIVLDLASGGELFSHITRLGSCHINCARWLTAELLNALRYMHGKGVLHRDLKPENILLDDLGHIKLVDFGSARLLDSDEPAARFVGTAEYVSPEVLDDEEATAESDLWALGCIVYQMLSGSPPFSAESEYLIFKRIEEASFSFDDGFPELARSFVSALLVLRPDERLGAGGDYTSLQEHPFFTEGALAIDFATVHLLPPPPLVPPPPVPAIQGDSVLNADLAARSLDDDDRAELVRLQAGTRWAALLADGEVIVLSSRVLKRRFLSVKQRQLLLVDAPSAAGVRLFYVDPESLEFKGEIPWSGGDGGGVLEFDLLPRGCFNVRVKGRTYHLEDYTSNPELAQTWVSALERIKARLASE